MKSREPQPRLFYPAKLSFRIKKQVKSLPDYKKLKEFIITKLLSYEMLKGLFNKKIKSMNNKMAINTYLSTIDSKKQTEQTRTETESWIWQTF